MSDGCSNDGGLYTSRELLGPRPSSKSEVQVVGAFCKPRTPQAQEIFTTDDRPLGPQPHETDSEILKAVVQSALPTDAKERKEYPIASGCLDYFPDALAEVAHISFIGNKQHNPGQPLHWDRTKSTDHADAATRHLIDRGKRDSDGARHSAKFAWRALALLQIEIEEERKQNG